MIHINEYTVVTGNTVESFTLAINEKIKQGWQPVGNISPLLMRDDRLGNTNIHYVQALGKLSITD